MRTVRTRGFVLFTFLIFGVLLFASLSFAQQRGGAAGAAGNAAAPAVGGGGRGRGAVPTGPTPRTADGKPDMSGLWNGGGSSGNIASAFRAVKHCRCFLRPRRYSPPGWPRTIRKPTAFLPASREVRHTPENG